MPVSAQWPTESSCTSSWACPRSGRSSGAATGTGSPATRRRDAGRCSTRTSASAGRPLSLKSPSSTAATPTTTTCRCTQQKPHGRPLVVRGPPPLSFSISISFGYDYVFVGLLRIGRLQRRRLGLRLPVAADDLFVVPAAGLRGDGRAEPPRDPAVPRPHRRQAGVVHRLAPVDRLHGGSLRSYDSLPPPRWLVLLASQVVYNVDHLSFRNRSL